MEGDGGGDAADLLFSDQLGVVSEGGRGCD